MRLLEFGWEFPGAEGAMPDVSQVTHDPSEPRYTALSDAGVFQEGVRYDDTIRGHCHGGAGGRL
jgi:hypothetical protein